MPVEGGSASRPESFFLVRFFLKVDSRDTAARIHVPGGAETIGTDIHNTLDAEVLGCNR